MADLADDVEVEVEGRLVSGILVADTVDIRPARNIKIEAPVVVTDGTLSMLGIAVVTNAVTRFEDHSSAHLETFDLGDISSGDFVEVRGFEEPVGSGMVFATRVERDDFEPDVELQGFIDSVQPSLVILGVTIQTRPATQFEDVDDNPITATNFFSAVAVDALVKAHGTLISGTVIDAAEVEFEN